ncbi:MAG: phage replisome organizer N-terminal domain-containing protein [Ignavibacteriaceae bacterium]
MNLSFIKLDINIMDDSKIKFIVKLPDGDKLFRLWVGLLCLGMKSSRPGIIEIGDNIPFTTEMLANHFDMELNTVKLALETFQRFKMIEFWDDQSIFICNFAQHQQLDKIEKARGVSRLSSARYREKIKLLGDGHVKISDETELDIDIDKDKEQELLIEFENNFWNPYDKKINKSKCFSKWQKLKGEDKGKIKEHIPAYVKSTPDKQYRKHPLTYLNNESWNDEVYTKQPVNQNNAEIPAAHQYL